MYNKLIAFVLNESVLFIALCALVCVNQNVTQKLKRATLVVASVYVLQLCFNIAYRLQMVFSKQKKCFATIQFHKKLHTATIVIELVKNIGIVHLLGFFVVFLFKEFLGLSMAWLWMELGMVGCLIFGYLLSWLMNKM